jgi:hypothetical protein
MGWNDPRLLADLPISNGLDCADLDTHHTCIVIAALGLQLTEESGAGTQWNRDSPE